MKPATPKAFVSNARLSEPVNCSSAELRAARSKYLKAEVRFRHALEVVCDSHPRNWGVVLARAVACRNRAFDCYQSTLERFAVNTRSTTSPIPAQRPPVWCACIDSSDTHNSPDRTADPLQEVR